MLDIFTQEQIDVAELQIVEHSRRIEYFMIEYSIELLAQKMKKHDFEIPDYQRAFTWEDERKSRFIESILIGLPIPFLFFWENPRTGVLEIVDGSQRLRTIRDFINGDFLLGDLDVLTSVSGFGFQNLPESRQRKFKNRTIRGIILNEHADAESRRELFDRINTGSKTANSAEIRRGVLQGPFLDLVNELANSKLFVGLTPVPEKKQKEREREELVTRFFAYGDGLEDYADEVSSFLFLYSKKMNVLFSQNTNLHQEYRRRFDDTMRFIENVFPFGFSRTKKGRASPRARFESIAVGSYLALKENPSLSSMIDILEKNILTWIQEKDFILVTGADGANSIKRLTTRLFFVRDKLLKV